MHTEKDRILVVDDDPELQELLTGYLKREGYEVATVGDGRAMDAWLTEHDADLIILDLMLPGEDGLSLAGRLRSRSSIPLIMVSARGEDIDRIIGLEVGADDYLAKPFNPRELLARIRAVLRRQDLARSPATPESLTFGPYCLNLDSQRLSREGKDIALTSSEFDLLTVFVKHPNRVLDRDRLLDSLKGYERAPFDRSIDVQVARLRGKIEKNTKEPEYIRTIWGKGYMFNPTGAAP